MNPGASDDDVMRSRDAIRTKLTFGLIGLLVAQSPYWLGTASVTVQHHLDRCSVLVRAPVG